jgi:hypothetical protein
MISGLVRYLTPRGMQGEPGTRRDLNVSSGNFLHELLPDSVGNTWRPRDVESYLYKTRELDEFSFVTDLYKTFLHRDPDQTGKGVYARRLRIGEIIRRRLVYEFLSSPEMRRDTASHHLAETGDVTSDSAVTSISDVIIFENSLYLMEMSLLTTRFLSACYVRQIKRDTRITRKC